MRVQQNSEEKKRTWGGGGRVFVFLSYFCEIPKGLHNQQSSIYETEIRGWRENDDVHMQIL